MSRKQNVGSDPVKRAERRRRQREAIARGSVINQRVTPAPTAQENHASSGKARKKARHGERMMDVDRSDLKERDA